MMRRKPSGGFVSRYQYLSVTDAATYLERDRRELWDRAAIGELPAMRSAGGQWIIPAGALGGVNRRLSEHD